MKHNTKRVLRRGGYIAGISILVIAVIVIINLIVAQLPSNISEFDISDNKIYTVSSTSVDFLSRLTQDVELVILANDNVVDERIMKFITNYATLSGHITITEIDPVAYPSALTEYGAETGSIVVINRETEKTTTISIDDIIGLDEYYAYYGYEYEADFDAEGLLTSAVDYVTSDTSNTVYALTNHGESGLPSAASDSIGKANIGLSSLNLLLDGEIPEDCSLLLSFAPTSDLADDELAALRSYLSEGGQLMLILSSEDVALPNWAALLLEYGLGIADGYIADMERNYSSSESYFQFFPNLSSSSSVTSGFVSDQDMALLYNARGLTEESPARDTITLEPFMTTSDVGYAVTANTEVVGTYILGAAATEETEGGKISRLTVISAQTLLDETILTSFGSLVNLDVFMNALTAGITDIENITIQPVSLEITYNTIANGTFWGVVFIAVIPIAILAGGLVFWIKRRRR